MAVGASGTLAMLVERRYASRALKRFAEEIGEAHATVRRYRWVASRYPTEARVRFSSLSFSHFQAVAALPDRIAWLQRAERGSWSVDRLVRETRGAGRPREAAPPLRAPVDAVERSLAAIAGRIEGPALGRDERQWLARALAEVAAEVERLRALLRAGTNGGRASSNGHARAARR